MSCIGRTINAETLKALLGERDQVECFILLKLGRSSKDILKEADGSYTVMNEIDGSTESFKTFEDMLSETNIGKAIENNAFYMYD